MSRRTLVAIAGLALLAASCSTSPERDFANGNKYFQNKQYRDASIAYRAAIQKNPRYGEAYLKLAEAYVAMNEPGSAGGAYVRAADLLPKNLDAQVKAATYLLLGGQFVDAQARAERALALDAKNIDALIVKGNAMARVKDLDGAIGEIEQAIEMDRTQARTYTTLGAFQAEKGNKEEAEKAFKTAIERDPKSVNARLALAQFYLSDARPVDAEQMVDAALGIEPGNVMANRLAAVLYVSTNRPADAERPLKAIVDATKAPAATVMLADYYVLTNRFDDAIRTLQGIANVKEWFAPARSRIAGIQYAQKKTADAHKTIDEVLAREPKHPAALLTKARFLVNEKKLDEALAKAKAAVQSDPRSAPAHYLLGTIYAARNDNEEAIKSFNKVLEINPRAAAAELWLSRLQLAVGNTTPALQFAERAVAAAPNSVDARLALARSLVARGELARAEVELRGLLDKYPDSAAVHGLMGTALLLGKDDARARREFERTLQLDATSFQALTGLVQLDVKARKFADARGRVEGQLARTPNSGPLLTLLAAVYSNEGNKPKAEQTLQKAIEVAPDYLPAYATLAPMYAREGKLDQAIAGLEELAKRQKKPVGAHTMIATILQLQNRNVEAQKRYQKVLELDPHAPVAANNLAWMYAEGGGNMDVALNLAQIAKQGLPDSAAVDDTLGWVYYKKGLASHAVLLLEQAAGADPKNATYQYHLGLACIGAGDDVKARQALEQALKIDPKFKDADAARKALASLQ